MRPLCLSVLEAEHGFSQYVNVKGGFQSKGEGRCPPALPSSISDPHTHLPSALHRNALLVIPGKHLLSGRGQEWRGWSRVCVGGGVAPRCQKVFKGPLLLCCVSPVFLRQFLLRFQLFLHSLHGQNDFSFCYTHTHTHTHNLSHTFSMNPSLPFS